MMNFEFDNDSDFEETKSSDSEPDAKYASEEEMAILDHFAEYGDVSMILSLPSEELRYDSQGYPIFPCPGVLANNFPAERTIKGIIEALPIANWYVENRLSEWNRMAGMYAITREELVPYIFDLFLAVSRVLVLADMYFLTNEDAGTSEVADRYMREFRETNEAIFATSSIH